VASHTLPSWNLDRKTVGFPSGESILMSMSKRLQIVVSDREAEEVRQAASRSGLSLSEWARLALRQARDRQLGPTPEQKLCALDRALACGYPVSDIEEMLSEVEAGRDLH